MTLAAGAKKWNALCLVVAEINSVLKEYTINTDRGFTGMKIRNFRW